ncbi:hypothetical protein CN326_03185 [Bacillus sp. AFS018417]|uniref:DUF3947 family protein n=1 Tax=Bacillus sp. AFS018417 TaxID=2033491 RepID=UPI000BF2934D|nr:DUF3947 family protein [Bacillus sp. AFS018417]PEZ09347.1 hypothetical protein CN326_03185 [Bacillus sp. AFS018417]
MINPFFNNTRQVGVGAGVGAGAVTFSSAQQTLHAIHQTMATDPLFTHVVYHYATPHYIVHHPVISHHVMYPAALSTIPFGSIYYL